MSSFGGRSNFSSYRGRGGREGRGFPPINFGNRNLVNSDISGLSFLKELEKNPEYVKKFQEFLKNNSEEASTSSSFANILAEQDDTESYERKLICQEIFILENKDLQWKEEPWHLIQRYLGTASYGAGSYKQRNSYESMLLATGSCEIRHFRPNTQAKIYNFSKIIIKQIISVEELGLNPLNEKEFSLPEQNVLAKFNFWDYKKAFYKTFLYQNPQHKHTWFIKVCPQVYRKKIPNWLYDWWIIYGGNENILPQQFLELFHKWKKVSSAIIEAEYDKLYCHNMAVLHFFCEFGIPLIWRWEPEVGYTQNNIPCLQRNFYIKFWKKMMAKNSEGQIEAQETISQIEIKIAEYEQKTANKQQRGSFNPFDIIEKRIETKNLSKREQFEKYMQEAKQAILEKLGSDIEMPDYNLEIFQYSQDPEDEINDINMAEFYSKLCNEKEDITSSESEAKEIETGNDKDEEFGDCRKGSKKKKGKNKKK